MVILQTTSGDGLSPSVAEVVMNRLNNFYNPHGLLFVSRDMTVVNDDYYAIDYSEEKAASLKSKYGKSDEITIFLLNSRANVNYSGNAHNIVSNYMSVAYGFYNQSTVEHEMGHCLGLYHTHQGTQIGSLGCPELVNGSNSATCGDYIVDTHADPCIWHLIRCSYAGPSDIVDANGDQYHPDPYNVMSYSLKQCRTALTEGQVVRIKEMLSTEQKLIAVSSLFSILGSSNICDEETYTIEGLPEGAEVYWSFGDGLSYAMFPPLEIIDGQGTAQATFKRGGEREMILVGPGQIEYGDLIPYVGTQTIRARVTLNGSMYMLEKEVTMEEIITPDIAGAAKIGTVAPPGTVLAMWLQGQAKTLSCTRVSYFTQAQVNNVRWTVTQPNGDVEYYSGTSITVTPNSIGRLSVTVTDGNQCHLANSCTAQYQIHGFMMQLDYSNPASGSVDISVVKQAKTEHDESAGTSAISTASAQQVYEEPYMGEYRLELWHEVYGMVREMDVEAGNPTVTMDLGGLTPGWYYMRLIADGEMKAVGKLMVR